MTTQLLFSVVPLDGMYRHGTVKLSVVVSPRLSGGDRLGDYSESMLQWTRRVREHGLAFELQAGAKKTRIEINPDPLQPDLWEALFTAATPVNAYRFDQDLIDRATRGVASFSMRETSSLIKAIYREASITLALPDGERSRRSKRNESDNRGVLAQLIGAMAVHWSDREAGARRHRHLTRLPDTNAMLAAGAAGAAEYAARVGRLGRLASGLDPGGSFYDDEGYLDNGSTHGLTASDRHDIAEGCMAFHHMPTPAYAEKKRQPHDPAPKSNLAYDPDKVIDFHQALSAMGNYPSLQRALGLVFDLEVPVDALELTPAAAPRFMHIAAHSLDGDFLAANGSVRTAYFLLDAGAPGMVFHTASRLGVARGAFGVAALDPAWFGLAQVDVDGAMHKTVLLAESLGANDVGGKPALATHPEVYDPGATLPALRSGGLSLYADFRALTWLAGLQQTSAAHADFEQGKPVEVYAENLTRGMRLDVWDDRTQAWHSLHERSATYQFFLGDGEPAPASFDPRQVGLDPALEEGWVESAVTRPAPGTPASEDHYYLHEAFARWAGWSLSAPRPDLALAADPGNGTPESDKEPDAPASPFKIKVEHRVVPGSLPQLRFGWRYRLRGRWVNLAGLSSCVNDAEGAQACLDNLVGSGLSQVFSLPNAGRDGLMYRRFEPVAPPQIVVDDVDAITGPGSTLQRLVIRTDNRNPEDDAALPADTRAASRHLLPPRVSVEMAEHMGMFDDADGKLLRDEATWQLIAQRDGAPPPDPADPLDTTARDGELPRVKVKVAGQEKVFPLIPDAFLAALPYLPDAWARGVALRDLPGAPQGSIGRVDTLTATGAVAFELLDDANPRAGSALLIGFGSEDWRAMQGLRLALDEPVGAAPAPPYWDADKRTLTVFLAKGERKVVPVSCYLLPADLPKMGIWQWLQEEAATRQRQDPRSPGLAPGDAVDELAHILQRTVEGGHWMLTPPVLLELVHALRQPLGQPAFQPLAVGKQIRSLSSPATAPLQTALTTAPLHPGTADIPARRDPDELAALTGWRTPASTEAYLLGALRVHAVATGRVELLAEWSDPIDDLAEGIENQTHQSSVDRIDLPSTRETYLRAGDASPPDVDDPRGESEDDPHRRHVGYYDPEHDQIVFVQPGDASLPGENRLVFDRVAAPRHVIGDTRHHRIRYRAVAVSRDADCFAPPLAGESAFSRESPALEVSIPASSRPLAPDIAHVLPTFGWQRQTDTAIKRSVRFGGGLRVYLKRPWFSSGEGERLGVVLWHGGQLDQATRDRYKSCFTQWGMDPIWQTAALFDVPRTRNFPGREVEAHAASLEEAPGLEVDVVGYPVAFDADRQLWYADLTLDAAETYSPFVRLALARYQPDALPDARLSRVVLADFAQVTPGRAVVVYPHPGHSRVLQVQISGIAPTGPNAQVGAREAAPPTRFNARVQERIAGLDSELGWRDVPLKAVDKGEVLAFQAVAPGAPVKLFVEPQDPVRTNLAVWAGLVRLPDVTPPGTFRLLLEEHEVIDNDQAGAADNRLAPERLIFAEIVPIDSSLLDER